MLWFYDVVRVMVRMLLLLFTDWQVRGRENTPSEGAVIVVANHINLTDPPILGVSLGRKTVFMAKKEIFRSRFLSYFLRGCGVFPVHRGRLDREAMRQASKVLTKGLALIVFPEGSRSKNTQLQPAFPGSALIALRNDVPILPVGIAGTERLKGAGWLLSRPHITVNIGSPFRLPLANGKLSKTELAELTNLMMRHIAELLPVEYRGHYA